MPDSSPILSVATLVSAFVGAVFGALVDRIRRRVESRPRFRIGVGVYENLKGRGRSLTITNVGLDPVRQYHVALFHPGRGSLMVFHGDDSELVFPQYPEQRNVFRCPTKLREPQPVDVPTHLKDWFHRLRDKPISAPAFDDFRLRLVLRNSELVLFEDQGLGNHVAKELYEDVTGHPIEQHVKEVYYRSKASRWVEFVRNRRLRRMLSRVEKERPTKG